MALQSSGEIHFSQLQSEFGGSNPISISEYYKNGSYVPSSITTTTTQGPYFDATVDNSPAGNPINNYYWGTFNNGATILYWASTGSYMAYLWGNPTSWTSGGWTYTPGSLAWYVYHAAGSNYYYYIKRSQSSSTTVNSNIPTSGTISLNQFYGGRNS